MLCATCGEPTEHDPCGACGGAALLAGRYRLVAVVGRGSSGLTYRASPVLGGPDVAIKEMMYVRAREPKRLEFIRREVSVLAQLSHPQIPRFIEAFDAGAGKARALCLVQSFIPGPTLTDEARTRRYSEADVLDVVADVADILTYIHGLQPPVIHRDLKPGNLIRDPSGALVLIDFGCVRDQLQDEVLGGSTFAVGTLGYMAPEQRVGDASPASDLYALGALALWLLTRHDPELLLTSSGAGSWRSRVSTSAATVDLIGELVEADPSRRPSSARAVGARARALARALREPPPHNDAPLASPPRGGPQAPWANMHTAAPPPRATHRSEPRRDSEPTFAPAPPAASWSHVATPLSAQPPSSLVLRGTVPSRELLEGDDLPRVMPPVITPRHWTTVVATVMSALLSVYVFPSGVAIGLILAILLVGVLVVWMARDH